MEEEAEAKNALPQGQLFASVACKEPQYPTTPLHIREKIK